MAVSRSQQNVFLAELLAGQNIKEACAKAGFAESTAHRLLKNEKFLRKLDQAQTGRILHISSTLAETSMAAIRKLVEIMTSGPLGMQLKAAIALLDQTTRIVVHGVAVDKAWCKFHLEELQKMTNENGVKSET